MAAQGDLECYWCSRCLKLWDEEGYIVLRRLAKVTQRTCSSMSCQKAARKPEQYMLMGRGLVSLPYREGPPSLMDDPGDFQITDPQDVQLGCWWYCCCEEDLREIKSEEDKAEALRAMDDDCPLTPQIYRTLSEAVRSLATVRVLSFPFHAEHR